MIIKRNTIMKEYNGRCKNGTNESLLILPNKNDVKLIISMTHEKAHTYQDNDQINEIIPSFFEILNAILLDKENPGLLHDDLDYKIKEAKKAASCYINFSSKFNDDKLKNFTDYMLQFLQAISLLDLYLDDKNEITNLLDDILFNKINYKDSLDRLFTYQDFDIETKIKNLRKA